MSNKLRIELDLTPDEAIMLWHRLNVNKSRSLTEYYKDFYTTDSTLAVPHLECLNQGVWMRVNNQLSQETKDRIYNLDKILVEEQPFYIGAYKMHINAKEQTISVGCCNIPFSQLKEIQERVERASRTLSPSGS